MTHVYNDIYVHMTWHTFDDHDDLRDELEAFVHEQIAETAEELGLELIAVNSAWDHVHVLVRWTGPHGIPTVLQYFKGRTARRWNEKYPELQKPKLKWQRGYGVLGVRHDIVGIVANYIDQQKIRHKNKRGLHPRYEKSSP